MEGNKDDALKCLRIEVGDRSQALKFISKARRLDPTLPVYDLSSEIEKESNGPGVPQPQGSSGSTNNGTSEPSKPSDQPSVRHQGPSSSSASSASASASYTENRDREAD
ncbi:chaperone protein dnaj 49 [Quercus suber]|uniref:Chaperone protein dnaj 49 n=1 Tax=Quercus suber TaxID=58331 RepID=A0AAW0JQ82_QUESU